MRTRAAILSTLALGFLLSTTGAGLAVSGLADNNQASQAQYPPPAPPVVEQQAPAVAPAPEPAPESQVLGEEESAPAAPSKPEERVAPATAQAPPEVAQPARQVEAGAAQEELPFTGFAALPVLLAGLALLSVGLVMRRSAGKD
jgi:hypothetical protein